MSSKKKALSRIPYFCTFKYFSAVHFSAVLLLTTHECILKRFLNHLLFLFFYFFNRELQTHGKDNNLSPRNQTHTNVNAWFICAAVAEVN